MPTYSVLTRQDLITVIDFLSQRSLRPRIRNPRTRVPALIQCNGIVHYTRSGTRTVISSESDVVHRGDFLVVADQCGTGQAQTAVANPGARDYAFIMPGGTFATNARRYMNRRPSTTAVTACHSLDAILRAICCPNRQSIPLARNITTPIDDVFIVSHAGETGALFCKLRNNSSANHVYLDELCPYVHDQNRTQITTRHIQNNANTNIYIRGCNVGKEPDFLRLIKQIFGNQVTVTAPLHEDYFGHFRDGRTYYRYEYMRYCFKLLTKTQAADKSALVRLFQGLNLADIHSNQITAAQWNSWIPGSIHPNTDVENNYTCTVPVHARMTVERLYRYRHPRIYRYVIRLSGTASFPTGQSDQVDVLRSVLPNERTMQANYPSQQCSFPEYRRWGYQNLTDFIDGLEWTFTPAGRAVTCSGYRHEYEVRIPITDAQSALMVNAFLDTGNRQYMPNCHGIVVTNTALFASV